MTGRLLAVAEGKREALGSYSGSRQQTWAGQARSPCGHRACVPCLPQEQVGECLVPGEETRCSKDIKSGGSIREAHIFHSEGKQAWAMAYKGVSFSVHSLRGLTFA